MRVPRRNTLPPVIPGRGPTTTENHSPTTSQALVVREWFSVVVVRDGMTGGRVLEVKVSDEGQE